MMASKISDAILADFEYHNPLTGKVERSIYIKPTFWESIRPLLVLLYRVVLPFLVGAMLLYLIARVCWPLPEKAKSEKYRRAYRHIYWMLVVLSAIMYVFLALALVSRAAGSAHH